MTKFSVEWINHNEIKWIKFIHCIPKIHTSILYLHNYSNDNKTALNSMAWQISFWNYETLSIKTVQGLKTPYFPFPEISLCFFGGTNTSLRAISTIFNIITFWHQDNVILLGFNKLDISGYTVSTGKINSHFPHHRN